MPCSHNLTNSMSLVRKRNVLLLFILIGFVNGFTSVSISWHGVASSRSSSLNMVSSIQKVQVGDSEIQLRHQLFLGDVESQNGADLTGLKYWPTASEPMLQAFQKPKFNYLSQSDKPLKILELGSGCGLLGIGVASLDIMFHVVVTDAPVPFRDSSAVDDSSSSTTLDWLQSNVELNRDTIQDRVSVQPLLWGDAEHLSAISSKHGPIDLVVGSELLYNNQASFVGLVETLRHFSSQKNPAKLLLGYKRRNLGESEFFDLAEQHFHIETSRIGRKCDGIFLSELTLL